MTRFCVHCGTEETRNNPVVNGVCLRCRIKRGELLKVENKEIYVELCRSCYSVKIGYKWIPSSGFKDAIDEVVEDIIPKIVESGEGVEELYVESYEYITAPSWRTVVRVYFKGMFRGVEFKYPMDFTIYFKPSKCPRCIMDKSREFEAVVRVRGFNKAVLESALRRVMSDKRVLENVIDIIEEHGGIDIYFYDKGSARHFTRLLSRIFRGSLSIREDYEIAGMRSGSQRARLYISIKPK